MKLGTKIDKLHGMKKEKKTLEAKMTKLKEKFNSLEKEIYNDMKKTNETISAGAKAKMSITTNVYPSVESWPKLYKHIKKTGDFDLLQKRVSTAAYNERLSDKKRIPGVKPFTKISMNLREL